MPEVSRFYGIVIRMFFREHGPPHFHAEYSGQQAVVGIRASHGAGGSASAARIGIVKEWASLHRAELRAAWDRARRQEAPGKIAPLE